MKLSFVKCYLLMRYQLVLDLLANYYNDDDDDDVNTYIQIVCRVSDRHSILSIRLGLSLSLINVLIDLRLFH